MAAAEQAVSVDAAARPQDRGYFEGWNQSIPLSISTAAQLTRKPLGGSHSHLALDSTT
jgi:hypothetical protein